MSGTEIVELTQEEMDCLILDAREGDLKNLQEIFDEISPLLLVKVQDDITLSTPIHMAAANGHKQVLEYLLSIVSKEDAKTLVNKQNESGNTPLHWAAYNGHLDIVKLLADDYEADVFIKNKINHDAMFEAENNSKSEIEQWFLKKYSVESDFKFEEGEEESKITYQPGKETKEADERAKLAAKAATTETTNSTSKDQSDNTLNTETEKLTIS